MCHLIARGTCFINSLINPVDAPLVTGRPCKGASDVVVTFKCGCGAGDGLVALPMATSPRHKKPAADLSPDSGRSSGEFTSHEMQTESAVRAL